VTFDPNSQASPVNPDAPTGPAGPEPFDPPQPAAFPMQPVVPVASAPLVKPKSTSRVLNVVLILAAAVALGGVAFAVGRSSAPVTSASARGNFPGGNFQGPPGASFAPGASGAPGGFGGGLGGVGGGLTLSGTVQSITNDTLTLTTESGQTVELSLDADTSYSRKSDAAASDVTTGSTVEVRLDFGAGVGRPTASTDASTPLGTASSVTVVP
jgi:hypothetical protein